MLFYFSGTGNSFHVASKLAEKLNEKLVSIAECMKSGKFDFDLARNEVMGIVSPVYFWNTPSIVCDFLEKLQIRGYDCNFTFVCFTCGGSIGVADKKISSILRKKMPRVSATYSVTMPDNYVILFDLLTKAEKIPGILEAAEIKIAKIADKIKRREPSILLATRSLTPHLNTYSNYPIYQMARTTRPFRANGNCIGCGLCAERCPCGAIEMKGGRPSWIKSKCTQCLSCLHRCPVSAVQYGRHTEKRGRYVNPDF